MGGVLGVKETKEVVSGAMHLGGLLYSRFKDGVQASDIVVILDKIKNDPELSAALIAAYNGADKVPAEVKELDIQDGVELGVHLLQEGAKLVKVLKA